MSNRVASERPIRKMGLLIGDSLKVSPDGKRTAYMSRLGFLKSKWMVVVDEKEDGRQDRFRRCLY